MEIRVKEKTCDMIRGQCMRIEAKTILETICLIDDNAAGHTERHQCSSRTYASEKFRLLDT